MNHLQKLFLEVADLDAGERARYFEQHQVGRDLRLEVESLLHFDQGDAVILNGVVGATVERLLGSVLSDSAGLTNWSACSAKAAWDPSIWVSARMAKWTCGSQSSCFAAPPRRGHSGIGS